ncbi:hypothetical protein [Kibdelosporangium philippinense]|uniref:hypothetical protein n=1 Tax=Kibdelosporangium philippinense TaxID=211113 RepID=UPI0036089196
MLGHGHPTTKVIRSNLDMAGSTEKPLTFGNTWPAATAPELPLVGRRARGVINLRTRDQRHERMSALHAGLASGKDLCAAEVQVHQAERAFARLDRGDVAEVGLRLSAGRSRSGAR